MGFLSLYAAAPACADARTPPRPKPVGTLTPLLILPALTLSVFFPQDIPAARLQPKTLKSWETYIELTEKRVAKEVDWKESDKFLVTDFLEGKFEHGEEARAKMKKGKVIIQKLKTKKEDGKKVPVPDGMIHHWVGSGYVPGVKLERLMAWIQNYDSHYKYFKEVEASKLLAREGDEFKIYLRLKRKKVITVFYNTDHTARYRRHDARRMSSFSFTTKIAELKKPDTEQETEKPSGQDRGFLWRLNSYWRFQEDEAGVFVECESVSLSRAIPFGLKWLIGGIVESVPRESLENTLTSIREGVTKDLQKARQNFPAPNRPAQSTAAARRSRPAPFLPTSLPSGKLRGTGRKG